MSIKDAISSPDAQKWQSAMQEEINSLHKNKVWTVIDLPKKRTAVGNRCIFKVKRDANGVLQRFKARLMAKGHNEREGVDYKEHYIQPCSSIRLS